jgi:hypothetical protein
MRTARYLEVSWCDDAALFDGLARGKRKAEALREAQLARIKAHRDRDGAAHQVIRAGEGTGADEQVPEAVSPDSSCSAPP